MLAKGTVPFSYSQFRDNLPRHVEMRPQDLIQEPESRLLIGALPFRPNDYVDHRRVYLQFDQVVGHHQTKEV